jgi:nitroreductase
MFMNTIEAISERSMYRGRFQKRELVDSDLSRIIEAAGWAPSGHNSQPWQFVVVDDEELIAAIAKIATDNFDAFLATSPNLKRFVRNFSRWLRWSEEELRSVGDGIYFKRMPREVWQELDELTDNEAIRERLVRLLGSRGIPSKLISAAPCLIFTLVNTEREIPDSSNDMMALTSTGAAMQNLRLAAHDLGIAVHEQSLLYDLPDTRKAMSKLLGIPGHCRIVGGMRLGYPSDTLRSSLTHVRRPAAAVMRRNGYDHSIGLATNRKDTAGTV